MRKEAPCAPVRWTWRNTIRCTSLTSSFSLATTRTLTSAIGVCEQTPNPITLTPSMHVQQALTHRAPPPPPPPLSTCTLQLQLPRHHPCMCNKYSLTGPPLCPPAQYNSNYPVTIHACATSTHSQGPPSAHLHTTTPITPTPSMHVQQALTHRAPPLPTCTLQLQLPRHHPCMCNKYSLTGPPLCPPAQYNSNYPVTIHACATSTHSQGSHSAHLHTTTPITPTPSMHVQQVLTHWAPLCPPAHYNSNYPVTIHACATSTHSQGPPLPTCTLQLQLPCHHPCMCNKHSLTEPPPPPSAHLHTATPITLSPSMHVQQTLTHRAPTLSTCTLQLQLPCHHPCMCNKHSLTWPLLCPSAQYNSNYPVTIHACATSTHSQAPLCLPAQYNSNYPVTIHACATSTHSQAPLCLPAQYNSNYPVTIHACATSTHSQAPLCLPAHYNYNSNKWSAASLVKWFSPSLKNNMHMSTATITH